MLKKFQKYKQEQELFSQNDKILLTISGGVDSCVMLDLLSKYGAFLTIAHCNFSLRGEDSEQDELFVRELAQKYKLKVHVKSFDTKKESRDKGISIQMAARNLRYTWFEMLCQANSYSKIATAHHQNDVIETVLFNLTKGTGIAGLHGILPKSGKIIRPILFASKEEVLNYAQKNKLSWREDISNQENKYSRNLIRNQVIPLLRNINPNLENTFKQNVEKFIATEKIFDHEISNFIEKNIKKKDNKLSLSIEVLEDTVAPLLYLYQWLKKYNFNYKQVKGIIKSLNSQTGKIFYSTDYQLFRERKTLILTSLTSEALIFEKIQENTKKLVLPKWNLTFESFEKKKGFEIPKSKFCISLDKDKLKFPLKIRTWKTGDYFYPLGMQSRRKKISDFLINQKIALHQKNEVLLLTSQEKIAYIFTYRLDENFKITNETKNIYQINITLI